MSYILSLKDINYSYIDGGFERKILDELNFDFERAKFYTILGPSGSGKSTLLAIMAGLDYPGVGSIWFEDRQIDSTNIEKYRRNDIARAMCSDINLIALKVDTLIAQGYQLRKQEHQNDFLKYSKKI